MKNVVNHQFVSRGEKVARILFGNKAKSFNTDEKTKVFTQQEVRHILATEIKTEKDNLVYNKYLTLHNYLLKLRDSIILQNLHAENILLKLHVILAPILGEEESFNEVSDGEMQINPEKHSFKNRAATIIEDGRKNHFIRTSLEDYIGLIRECFIGQCTVNLIAEKLNFQEIKGYLPAINTTLLGTINKLMECIVSVMRDQAIKQQLTKVLSTIDEKQIKPTQAAMTRAKKLISLDIFDKNNEQDIYVVYEALRSK